MKYTHKEYIEALNIVNSYRNSLIPIKKELPTDYKEKAKKWFENLVEKDEWVNMEIKQGYYGHDMGITMEDIINMYKREFNFK